MTQAIEARRLSVALGGHPVLTDVDLTVPEGGLFALLGPNGAGKTTFLRTVLGTVKPLAGMLSVAGDPPRRAWRHVGYVPQRHAFAWDFPISVEGAVLSGRTKRIGWLRAAGRDDYRAARDAIDVVGLGELAARPVGELSGGQRQRVLIARALASRPSVLLLDEPFTGVDVPTQDLLTELLRGLVGDGRTVLLTTHDLPQAMSIADTVALVNRRVIAQGSPAELGRPDAWMAAFGVSETSSLLANLGVAAC
ncbi:MAG TPA: anchored repeat-type ABC transporter ATP-binding subunit [Arachnia sp.]|nr:anchored repeat-type ABC transporter ATP-binding subunit [Arachnia sp.]HMT87076.1 anchored repeat-type ABC transporter ATP-binding subunit [Arachnia sp.]